MRRRSYPAFTRLDAMVLVLAAMIGAGGMAVESWKVWPGLFERPRNGWADFHVVLRTLRAGLATLTPMAWSLSAAVLCLSLRLPRADRLRLARRPGLAACLAATLAYSIDFAAVRSMLAYYLRETMGGPWLRSRWTKVFSLDADHYVDLHLAGYAVLAAWLVLRLGGRWRAERSWVDRAGRALGAWWVAMIVCHWFTDLA